PNPNPFPKGKGLPSLFRGGARGEVREWGWGGRSGGEAARALLKRAAARVRSVSLPRLRFWLLVTLVFAIPIVIYLPNTEYGYTKSTLLYWGISLLIVLWAVELFFRSQVQINVTRLAWPALGVVGAAALSLINAENLALSLISFVGLIYFGLLGLLIVNTIESERDIKILLSALLLSASIASVYGLLQYYGRLPGPPGFLGGSSAMISTFGNPNYLAGFLAHLLVPGIALSVMVQNRWARLGLLGLLISMTAALVAANSVGAYLAALFAVIFFFSGMLIFRLSSAIASQRRWVLAVVILLALTVWLQSPPGPLNALLGRAATSESSPIERVVQFFQRLWEENSGIARSWNWWIAYEMLKAHPFVGVGVGDYKVEFLEYKARFKETPLGGQYNFYLPRAIQAHNDYVQLIAELGLIGLLAVGFFAGTLIRSAHSFVRSSASPESRVWVIALSAGIVAFLTDALVSFPLHLPASELNLVLFISLLYARPLLGPAPTVTLRSSAKLAVGATTLALALVVSFFAYRDWQADIALAEGEAEMNSVRYETARIALERSVALGIAPGKALYYLGVVYAERGELQRARDYFERSLKTYPTENAYIQLADLALRLGEAQRAQEHLKTLLRLDPEPTMRLEAEFMQRVLVPLLQGDRTLVWAELGKFLQEHPDYPRGYLVRGALHRERGEHEIARTEFERGLHVIAKLKENIQRRLDQIQRSRRLADPDELTQLRARAAALAQMEAQLRELIAQLR
ncbi:MAG: tetratricopeptide repeat protein, partial [Candidatus Bipolaricaulota bacterium]|nr:tetratricopeptide repeat protein [Candidatus Bipolaricaulota bacterium]